MTANFSSNREKSASYLYDLLEKILHLLQLSKLKAKVKFILQRSQGHYANKSHFQPLSDNFIHL